MFTRLQVSLFLLIGASVIATWMPACCQAAPCPPAPGVEKNRARANESAPPADKSLPRQLSPAAEKKSRKAEFPSGTAALGGVILDSLTQSPLPGVRVLLIPTAAPDARIDTRSDEDGKFSFKGLGQGEWTLRFSREGLFSHSQKLPLSAGQESKLKVTMEEVETADIVKVTGKRKLVHAERLGNETRLDKNFLKEYKSGDSLRDVIKSAPGVMPDSVGNIIVRGEHNAVSYDLDGVVLPEPAGTLSQAQFASPRALQSVDVEVGGYSAADGGAPLGAIVKMKSLPIQEKPQLVFGGQLGGPIAGNLNYFASGALSRNPNKSLHRLRVESSGSATTTWLGLEPPVKNFVRNGRLDLNFLTKAEFQASEKDKFKLTVAINESFMQLPTSGTSRHFGVRLSEHDREDLVICSYRRKGERWFDEANLHVVNAFYSQLIKSRNTFDPFPQLNGDNPLLVSTAPRARRFNYALSVQGDVSKTYFSAHKLNVGFLSEIRPVSTGFSSLYYNANAFMASVPFATTVAYGAPVSPFTNLPGGPLFVKNMGAYRGFRYTQSGYLQDTWQGKTGILKRLTVNAGVRADVYHGIFGDTLKVAQAIATIPGAPPFLREPFQRHAVTDAQASGRFGASLLLTPATVLRASFANIFQAPPVDIFSTPPDVAAGTIAGIFNGTARPLRATRGLLVDTGIEQQVGPRFLARTTLFYKKLKNFGDSGVVQNTPAYNRLSLSNQESYGVETRVDLKPAAGGYGFHGFLSSTVAVSYLRGHKGITGGVYDLTLDPILIKFPDHDRRLALSAGLGYRARNGLWCLAELNEWSGLKDNRDAIIFGEHPARTRPITLLGFNCGLDIPKDRRQVRFMPSGIDVRIENLLNVRQPINLASPFQGTRYTLPLRVLAGLSWKI